MNKSQVTALLMSNERAIEAALLGLLARQTMGEQVTGHTSELNGRGFNRDDAPFGTSLAEWVKRGKRLTPRQRKAAVPLCAYYWRQVGTMPEVLRQARLAATKEYKLYSQDEMCVAIAQWDRFQPFPGVTQGL